MSSPSSNWPELILRLEADVLARRNRPGCTDEGAWYAAHHLLRAQARMLLRLHPVLTEEDLDDVAQSVLIKLQSPETMRRLGIAGSPGGYIAVMMRNACLDIIRRKKRDRDRFVPSEDEHLFEWHPQQTYSDRNQRLEKLLDKLSTQERALLKMRFWQDMSLNQIAETLGISYSAAAVRSFRALRRLRESTGKQ
jgi:RNA polymerase sigma factor (sigma-70 family)